MGSKWAFNVPTWTPQATADTTVLPNQSYMALQGGTASSFMNVLEVYLGGQASSSATDFMLLGYDSTVGATTTAAAPARNGALAPSTAALAAPQVFFTGATTQPKRSATLAALNLSFNAFGGIVKWTWAPGEEIGIYGNAASVGEMSLSAFTGSAAGTLGSHIIYETV